LRVFRIKGRSYTEPLSVVLHDIDSLFPLIKEMPHSAELMIERFWPGALTIIFPSASSVPVKIRGRGDTIGVRIPAHKGCMSLLRCCGVPITSTSLNISGGKPARSIEDISKSMQNQLDIILDEGVSLQGGASSVVDLTTTPPTLLREGRIPSQEIQSVLGELCMK